ncbi:antA/AntB antirepressor family protein [uncultured Corynebacterium sp.]|uniref:antA/AntB antirepressor family protein n=1 Tax=uncultured Corynebacterium sp. TaxID=159447 RepID=UPI0026078CE9|nr:antA/AntB antirepressor family protein [uncultured Corynebacterium sp.]
MEQFPMLPDTGATGLIPIERDGDNYAVMGRDLHEFLEVSTEYRHWFPRMIEYGFEQDKDYTVIFDRNPLGGRPAVNHIVSLDMAKELCMIQRTERGKQARQYFIEAEKQLRAADTAPAHQLPQDYASALRELANAVDTVEAQREQIALDAPKVEYHDQFIKDDDLLSFRTVASSFGIGERNLRQLLIDRKWIYRESTQTYDKQKGWRTRNRYSEHYNHKPHFRRVLHHDVPKFNGEVMHTLKITPDGAAAILGLLDRIAREPIEMEELEWVS